VILDLNLKKEPVNYILKPDFQVSTAHILKNVYTASVKKTNANTPAIMSLSAVAMKSVILGISAIGLIRTARK
jgi:hypothetical protein